MMDTYIAIIEADETTDGVPVWVAWFAHLGRGCMGQGTTPPEAVADAWDAARDFVASMVEDGLPVTRVFGADATAILRDES